MENVSKNEDLNWIGIVRQGPRLERVDKGDGVWKEGWMLLRHGLRLENSRRVSCCPGKRAVQSSRLSKRGLVNATVGDDARHRDNSHWMVKRVCTVGVRSVESY